MAFTDINTGIEIKRFGTVGSGSDFGAEITAFTEDNSIRKINYTQIIGGMIVPEVDNIISKTISFDFVVEDFDIIRILQNGGTSGSRITDLDINEELDKYKIALKFTSGTNYYHRFYYNAYVEEFTHSMDEGVLMGSIKFSIPIKNIKGDNNYYISEEEYATVSAALDITMGYNT